MEDKRNILMEEQPFDYKEIKDNKVQIYFHNKLIKTILQKDYKKFKRIEDKNDSYQMQLFLAKVTGHFKHGNER